MKNQVYRRLTAAALTVLMCVSSAQAINNINSRGYNFVLAPFDEVTYYTLNGKKQITLKSGTSVNTENANSFGDVYAMFANPTLENIPMYDTAKGSEERGCVFTNESSFAMMIADTGNTSHELEAKLEVANRYAQIGTYNVFKTVTLKLTNGLSVENGGLLLQNTFGGSVTSAEKQKLVVQLGAPAEVGVDGRLILDGTDNVASNMVGSPPSELIAPEGQSAIIVNNGGQVEIANFEVKRSADDNSEASLIEVNDGGELIFFASGLMRFDEETGMPVYNENGKNPDVKVDLDNGASSSPAVSVADGATVTVEAGDFTTSGDGAIFDLADGATLNLEGGTITSEGETPAITVGKGATVVIPEDSKAEIKSEGGNAAIDLAPGASVQQGGNTITVAPIEDESASNYVDNHGNIVLESGSEDGKVAPNTVIQPDGTAISGKDNLPTVDSEGNVTIPEGGATVTNPEGDKVEVGSGAEIPSIVIGVKDADGNVETSKSIKLGDGTLTLETAVFDSEIDLKDYTCTVKSDDETVATAELKGGKIVVTPVSTGTANITATYTKNSGAAEGIALLDEGEATPDNTLTATFTVTVEKESSGGGSSGSSSDHERTYAIVTEDDGNGSVTVSADEASAGTRITVTVKPDTGYELDELTVTDAKNKDLKLTKRSESTYTFHMADSKVTVEVSFARDGEAEKPGSLFDDVSANAYYADAVKWAVEQGITSGTSATTFSPDMSCTRAQIVTFLWRANGSPKADGANPFTDVSADAYYYDAVLWAVKEGITSGTGGNNFSPDATVTRGQTVTFLYRAAGAPAVTGGSFADVAADAYYADAVAWAVKEGVTSGTSATTFSPDAPCTRGQIVTFLYHAQ